jgi:hypothetical protein
MQRIERKAIMKKLLSRLSAVGGLMVVVQLIFSSVAIASQPIIEADVVCEEDSLYVTYTATAWEGWPGNPDSRLNPAIEIYVDGILVHTGAFTDPNYAFSGSIPLPAGLGVGDTLPVMALAAAPWGTGLPGDNTAPGGSSDSVTVTVPDDECGGTDLGTGRFTGGGNIRLPNSVRVTRGLTIHCDLLLSNNLQVNWSGGNKFHMTEHIETVACSDDPNIHQAPPDAPLDTLIGIGTGRYNGTGARQTWDGGHCSCALGQGVHRVHGRAGGLPVS